jgi:DNA-directed RNA polymerase subunit omega
VNQLGGGIGAAIPPQVASTARKPLSIAFEEIAADKITLISAAELEAAEEAAAAAAESTALAESDGDDEG